MSQPLSAWIPILLFVAASYNGVIMTLFFNLWAQTNRRLENLENILMKGAK